VPDRAGFAIRDRKASVDTSCATTSYKEFLDSIHDSPAQAIQFMRTLVQRLRQMNKMVEAGEPQRKGFFRTMFQDWQRQSTRLPPDEVRWWMFL
jgi:hypothetical protein